MQDVNLFIRVDAMKMVALSPYWIDVAVDSFVHMQSFFLSSAPSVYGKSVLLQSISIALLETCGFMVLAESA